MGGAYDVTCPSAVGAVARRSFAVELRDAVAEVCDAVADLYDTVAELRDTAAELRDAELEVDKEQDAGEVQCEQDVYRTDVGVLPFGAAKILE